MKVWIDRDTCEANLATCLSCFGQFVRTGAPDRGCILDYEEDGEETCEARGNAWVECSDGERD